ncbi:MAG: WXG100 family type VII secretion target [Actinomycetaceae bacterium]
MSDFEAEIGQLETAASNARDASGEIGGVDLAAAIDGIATAMPGSTSATSVTDLQASWTEEKDALVTGLDDYAQGLEDAATIYRTTDQSAADAFGT